MFIKKFSKISIPKVCEKSGVDRSNLLANRTTPENERLVYKELRRQLLVLLRKK